MSQPDFRRDADRDATIRHANGIATLVDRKSVV